MVVIDFQGDFNTDETLTFTVPPNIIENYDGPPLTAALPVTVETELRVAKSRTTATTDVLGKYKHR